jgi:hypothetical protein
LHSEESDKEYQVMKIPILYLLFSISIVAFAQQKTIVKAEIDTTNVRIGEQFEYKITVQDTANVILPTLEDIEGLEIIEDQKIDTIKNQLIKRYILTGFDSGAFFIPQQQIFIRQRLHLTDSLLIKVATITVDTTAQKLFPIKAIQSEPYQFDDYKKYVWFGLAALLLIGLLLYFLLKKKAIEIAKESIPSLPPYEDAIQKLHALDKKLLWQNNKVKKYYSELTEIVKDYIERELKVPALESTTDELIDALNDFLKDSSNGSLNDRTEIQSVSVTKETIKKLRDLLRQADLVKFAKSKPMSEEIEESRKDAEEVVHQLKPKTIEEDDELE